MTNNVLSCLLPHPVQVGVLWCRDESHLVPVVAAGACHHGPEHVGQPSATLWGGSLDYIPQRYLLLHEHDGIEPRNLENEEHLRARYGERKIVWRPPLSGPYSHDIWAPELHFLRGKWYIYFAADGGRNDSHRIWVLENAAADPLDGKWQMLGKVADPSDRWAIDATVFEQDSRLYMVWSGWEGEFNGGQNLYIAELSSPNTVKGSRVRISAPEYPWEKIGDLRPQVANEANPGADPTNPIHVDVNEGPEILRHGNLIFLVYSAGGCWTDYYSLGILTASVASNVMDPASWKKTPTPVFWLSPEAHAYGTGHNSFFKSPDGKEDWILYHANSEPRQGCGNRRAPRAQPFTWKPDGMPDFGRPVGLGVLIAAPSGGN